MQVTVFKCAFFAVMLIALLPVGLSNFAQSKRRQPSKPTNKSPVITKFESSAPIVKTCGPWQENLLCDPKTRRTVTLTVAASDPEGERLTYEYLTTGGEIVGTGESV